jgi:hypothetical protein
MKSPVVNATGGGPEEYVVALPEADGVVQPPTDTMGSGLARERAVGLALLEMWSRTHATDG